MSQDSQLLKDLFKKFKQEQLQRIELQDRDREPAALIGMACRFPGGVDSPKSFWRFLDEGSDAVGPVSDERWNVQHWVDPDPEAAGKMYSSEGGYLRGPVDAFDARLFNLSPREARALDPQQRLLLEVSWEAIEHAGLTAGSLRGSATGVFIGISGDDYARAHRHSGCPDQIDAYSITGTTASTAAGRLSYFYDFRGPAMAVDTACSSSLVALHLGVQSLRRRESDLVLVGGVNLILTPELHVAFSKLKAMSPSGRCRTFDAAADGYVRGEGCGVLALKRLSKAKQDGDRILAVVRGTAVNQDGRSNGLTAPNGEAQKAVIRQALQDAGIEPWQVDYLEAHGTGTSLGDLIEMESIGQTFAERNSCGPLRVGSVKTNFGHLEAAAGTAGLIKIVLALQAQKIPAHLHFQTPSPRIPWAQTPVEITAAPTPWPNSDKSRVAGLSAFGFSGTNAHVILEEAPRPATQDRAQDGLDAPADPFPVLTLSAADPQALKDLAGRYAQQLSRRFEWSPTRQDDYWQFCAASNLTRRPLAHRLAVVAGKPSRTVRNLEAFGGGRSASGLFIGGPDKNHRTAFLFPGQGSQYPGMGRELLADEPVFRRTMSRCDEILKPLIGASLLDLLYVPDDRTECLTETRFAQPALFSLSASLVQMWRAYGVTPSVVLGHSVGEFAAAQAAGLMSLEDGLRLIAERGRLMQLTEPGAMAVVHSNLDSVRQCLQDLPADGADKTAMPTIAAVNGPKNVVISGSVELVERAQALLQQAGARTQRLPVSRAFHAPTIEPALDGLRQAVGRVTQAPVQTDWILNLTGRKVADFEAEYPNGDYWVRQARSPVLFAQCLETLDQLGCDLVMELGPGTALSSMARGSLRRATFLPSLRRGRSGETVARGLACHFAQGRSVDWQTRHNGRVQTSSQAYWDLPTYPFQRRRYWALPADDGPSATQPTAKDPKPNAQPVTDIPMYRLRRHAYTLPATELQTEIDTPSFFFHTGLQSRFSTQIGEALVGRGCGWELSELEPSNDSDQRWIMVVADPAETLGRIDPARLDALLSFCRHLPSEGVRSVDWVYSETPECVALARGLAEALKLEHPQMHIRLIRVEQLDVPAAEAVAEALSSSSPDDFVFRRGQWWTEALEPTPPPHPSREVQIRADCQYLITGGTGDLGLLVADWLVHRGARHVVLTSRGGPQGAQPLSDSAGAVESLRARGAEVQWLAADATDEQRMQEILDEIHSPETPLRGVIHAAGQIESCPLGELTASSFLDIWGPKAEGARLLDKLTQGLPLEIFWLFGSVSGFWGSPRSAHYSAANAYLRALAQRRHREGQVAQSVSWGPWRGTAMVEKMGASDARLQSVGLRALNPESARVLFDRALSTDEPDLLCVDARWADFLDSMESAAPRALFATLRAATEAPTPSLLSLDSTSGPMPHQEISSPAPSENPLPGDLRHKWLAVPIAERPRFLMGSLRHMVAEIADFQDPEDVSLSTGLFDMGLDSLMAVILRRRLENALNLELRSTLAFDFPNLKALCSYLSERLSESSGDPASPAQGNGSLQSSGADSGSYETMRQLLEQSLESSPQAPTG